MDIRHLGKGNFKVSKAMEAHSEKQLSKVKVGQSVGEILSLVVVYDFGNQSVVRLTVKTSKLGTIVVESKNKDMYAAITESFNTLNKKLKSMDEKIRSKSGKKSISENFLELELGKGTKKEKMPKIVEKEEYLEFLDIDEAIEIFKEDNKNGSLTFRDLADGQIKSIKIEKKNVLVINTLM